MLASDTLRSRSWLTWVLVAGLSSSGLSFGDMLGCFLRVTIRDVSEHSSSMSGGSPAGGQLDMR